MAHTTHQWVGFELAGVQHAAFGPCVWQSMVHKVVIVIGADNLQRKKKQNKKRHLNVLQFLLAGSNGTMNWTRQSRIFEFLGRKWSAKLLLDYWDISRSLLGVACRMFVRLPSPPKG